MCLSRMEWAKNWITLLIEKIDYSNFESYVEISKMNHGVVSIIPGRMMRTG